MLAVWVYVFIGSAVGSVIENAGSEDGVEYEITKIMGGQDARKGQYPWQISLRGRNPMNPRQTKHVCGGSIIDYQWVLTASHCFNDNQNPSSYFVVAGDHDLKSSDGTEQNFNIERIIRHPRHSQMTNQNDVTLIKISGRFTLNQYVYPINLATPQQAGTFEGNDQIYCATSGWGSLYYKGPSPTILQELQMPLLPLETCRENYRQDPTMYEVTRDMLCTGYLDGGISPCHGDSGGPLACYVDNKWFLAGVTSWGKDCGVPGFPGLFARVSYFYNWIVSEVSRN